MLIQARAFGSQALRALLEAHPFVQVQSFEGSSDPRIEFDTGRKRVAYQGKADTEFYGLTELMDNNPLVCADQASMTGHEATLALIALGPLAKAELLLDPPAIAFNFGSESPEEVDDALATEGWVGGAAVATADGTPTILAAECMANIRVPGSREDVDALYAECFGRSFFVRESDTPPNPKDAFGTYTITLDERGDGTALAKVVSASAAEAKCGAGGLVHLFNVMCGFEESLGVAEG
jgi:N-acetyl-gamma-glutamylphosphate reductase